MEDSLTDTASLSHLSSQLQSLGFIHRPLDVFALFSATTTTTTTTSSSSSLDANEILAHQKLLQKQARAREQLIRCLWNMLSARAETSEGMERVAGRERVLSYELERTQGMLSKEQKLRQVKEKDAETERAKAKNATTALATEQERHRHAKEELNKAKSALQFVKTQAAHDQKRRDVEIAATSTRLQRLTSDPAQSKFIVLNSALSASATAPRTSNKSSLSSSSPSSTSPDLTGEVAFLQEALDECEESRRRAQEDNTLLRDLVGEVQEWTEGMLDLTGVMAAEEVSEVDPDESYLIPAPHQVLSVTELAGPVHNKLYRIRMGVQSVVTRAEARLEAVQTELAQQVEEERVQREEEMQGRAEAEQELANAREMIQQSERLVSDFANQRFLSGTDAPVDIADISADDTRPIALPEPVAKTTTEDKAAVEAERIKAFEAKRAMDLNAFLDDLGIDSPAPTEKAKLVAVRPSSSSSSRSTTAPKTSTSSSTSSAPVAPPRTSSSSSLRSRPQPSSSRPQLSPLAEESSSAGTSSLPPSPFLSSAPAPVAKAQLPSQPQPQRRALAGILAMADDSPPIARPALKSSSNTGSKSTEVRTSREKETRKTVTITTSASVNRTGGSSSSRSAKENGPPRVALKPLERAGKPTVF